MTGQIAYNLLPAVVIGGPPHSGKSVLAYSLSKELRRRQIDHYLFRAYPPDGEGDWFLDGDASFVRHFRVKGARSEAWLAPLIRDIAQRRVPLIVDLGGLPTKEQEAILDACTHAVLLVREAASHATWEARMNRHGLVLLADLVSHLHGENILISKQPLVKGQIAGLNRGTEATGPVFEALAAVLAAQFFQASEGVRRRHLEAAPVELAVDLQRLATHLGVDPQHWPPSALPAVLDYLPAARPIGLYGRGPNWLYAAVAAHTCPAPFYLFDVRRGWIQPPPLGRNQAIGSFWNIHLTELDDCVAWIFELPEAYLDLSASASLPVPTCPESGLILSGKLPHWLWAALARTCSPPWVAVLQPQLQGAVVIKSQGARPQPGTVIPVSVEDFGA